EAAAIRAVFGARAVPVTAPFSFFLILLAAAGSLDLAAALLSIRDGVLPPAVNERAEPGDGLDRVTAARGRPGRAGRPRAAPGADAGECGVWSRGRGRYLRAAQRSAFSSESRTQSGVTS
ncbi:hypothetical protein JFN87_24570, partial [Streptomyces bomunensis]|nr:hypothetical protein [Streptomyces montanisoli]